MILGHAVLVATVATLLVESVSYATMRSRSFAETVLNDSSTRITLGFHGCRVNEDGSVSCWGDNQKGQLGDGTLTSRSTPALVSGLTNVVGLASGAVHTCAVLGDGGVRCWGDNIDAQLGDGTTIDRLTPVAVSGVTNAVAITAGRFHTCALIGDGTARCWGHDADGRLGDGVPGGDQPFPVQVVGLTSAVAIAAGRLHTCAVVADGGVRCWGNNVFGQLGDGTTTTRFAPVIASGVVGAVGIAAGFGYTCAVIGNGTARCWGFNGNGRLGDGTTTNRLTAVFVNGLPSRVVDVAITSSHACARLADGTVRCWGNNQSAQLGEGSTTGRLTPAPPVPGITNAVAVAAGSAQQSCALLADGSARCWGSNVSGALGNGTLATGFVPTAVLGGGGTNTARDVAAGSNHTCAVRANGAVACWGDNTAGQLGDGTTVGRLTPVAVGGLTGALAVAAGESHSCAVVAGGSVRCWGENGGGQLGDGTTTRRSSPVPVSGLTNVVGIATGDLHTCAVLADGGVRCWGDNPTGQLGDGTTTRRLLPIPVTIPVVGPSANTAAIAVAAGSEHTCVRLADGTVRCWGGGGLGQLGLGTFNNRLSPVAGNAITIAVAIAAGDFHTCVLRATLITFAGAPSSVAMCWGANFSGSLGDGTITQRPTPFPSGGLASGVALAAGAFHTCAVLANGRTLCWGDNTAGQIGDGTTTQRLVPTAAATASVTAVPGGPTRGGVVTTVTPIGGVVQVAAGRRHTCALGSNGGLRCWGENFFGQLGTSSTANALRPVVVPSFLLNIDPLVSLHRNERLATVTILAICDEDDGLRVDVTLTQDSLTGSGHAFGRCTGTLERYPVTVHANGPVRFSDGPARVEAAALMRDRGVVVDTAEWTRAVNVAAP